MTRITKRVRIRGRGREIIPWGTEADCGAQVIEVSRVRVLASSVPSGFSPPCGLGTCGGVSVADRRNH